MAITLEELSIKFSAEMGGLNSQLNSVKQQIGGIAAPTIKAQGALSSLAKMGAMLGGVAIGAKLAQVGAEAVKMANDAVESENLFEVAMGGMASSTRAWSEDLSKALGLNAYEVRKSVGTFNTMFNSMGIGADKSQDMSQSLTALAQDMASFYNLSPDEAFTKLSAGITGETEGLKRIGILIDEATISQYAMANGISKTGKNMTQQEKVMARYGAIMKQTSKAQGDLARTAESPTNQLRRMTAQVDSAKIALGTALQPALLAIIPVLTSMAVGAGNVIKSLSDMGGGKESAFDGIVVTLDEAREAVKKSVDTSLVDIVDQINTLSEKTDKALDAYIVTEKENKKIEVNLDIQPPTTTGADRVKTGIDGLAQTLLGYTSVIRKTVTALLDAQLAGGEITQAEYNTKITALDKRLDSLDKTAVDFRTQATAMVDTALKDGEVTEKEAGAIGNKVKRFAETTVKAIKKDELAQIKAVDAAIKSGDITEQKGGQMKLDIQAAAVAAVDGVTAQITAVNAEMGTLNWADKTFTQAETDALAGVITSGADAAELVINAAIDKVNATWATAGMLGEAVTKLFEDAKTEFETNNATLREMAQSWIDGAKPTAEAWTKATAIRAENAKLLEFALGGTTSGAKLAKAGVELRTGTFSPESISNYFTAFDEAIKTRTASSKTLLDQRMSDLFTLKDLGMDEALQSALKDLGYGNLTLDQAVDQMIKDMAASLTLENNADLSTAAKTLIPSLDAALNSGKLSGGQVLGYVEQVQKLLDGIDFSTLDAASKRAVTDLIMTFNTPQLYDMFGGEGPFAEAMEALGITFEVGGKKAGESLESATVKAGESAMDAMKRALDENKITADQYDTLLLNEAMGTLEEYRQIFEKSGNQAMVDLIDALLGKKPEVKEAGKEVTDAAGTGIQSGGGGEKDKGAAMALLIAEGLKSKDPVVAAAANDLLDAPPMSPEDKAAFAALGAYLGQGLIDGMHSKIPDVIEKAKQLVREAKKGITITGEISSPSKMTERLGAYLGEGFALGISGSANLTSRAAASLANSAAGALSGINTSPIGINQSTLSAGVGVEGAVERGIARGIAQVMDKLNINLNVDGERFGRASIKAINETQMRTGRILLNM